MARTSSLILLVSSLSKGEKRFLKLYTSLQNGSKFLNQAPSLKSSVEKERLWKKIETEFEAIKNDKYEIQILKIFNFSSWIEAKLCKKSFSELLKAKYEGENVDNNPIKAVAL